MYELGDTATRAAERSRGLAGRPAQGRAGAGLRRGAVRPTLLPELVRVARPDARSPAPAGWKQRGLRARSSVEGERGGASGSFARGLQGLLRRGGRAGNDPEPGCGRASCSRIWRPRGEGRRLRAQRKVVRRRALSPFSERGGWGQWGRAVRWPGAVRVRGRGDGAPEALSGFCQPWACSRRPLARPV